MAEFKVGNIVKLLIKGIINGMNVGDIDTIVSIDNNMHDHPHFNLQKFGNGHCSHNFIKVDTINWKERIQRGKK